MHFVALFKWKKTELNYLLNRKHQLLSTEVSYG